MASSSSTPLTTFSILISPSHSRSPCDSLLRRLNPMEEKSKNKNKKQKHQHPNDQTAKTDFSFKPSSDVKGLRFGGQFIVKSFTIRRAHPLELLALPPAGAVFASAAAYLPTNFTILAHHAWNTLTLGLGTKKSKVVVFVFESEGMCAAVESLLSDVNRKLIRGLSGCEMARFKFRKGCSTFYMPRFPQCTKLEATSRFHAGGVVLKSSGHSIVASFLELQLLGFLDDRGGDDMELTWNLLYYTYD